MTSCSLAAIVSRRWSLHFCFVASDLSYARAGGGSGGGGRAGGASGGIPFPKLKGIKVRHPRDTLDLYRLKARNKPRNSN